MKKKKALLIMLPLFAVVLFAACSAAVAPAVTVESAMKMGIWDYVAIPLGWIMKYCYLFANDVLRLPLAYVFALFLFTLITKILLFPLSIKQQRSTAMAAAYKPMIDEINKKYANDKQKQQEELQKMQTEYGYNPAAGCLPLLIQFPIIFGLLRVIYKPLTHMISIPKELITKILEITLNIPGVEVKSAYFLENTAIQQIKTNIGAFSALTSNPEYASYIDKITNLDMSIGSINLWENPVLGWSLTLIVPLFSIVTMLLSTLISMKKSGSAETGGASGKGMMIFSALLFGVFSFTYPMGFSFYWGFQNIILIGQSFILYKICNPEKLRAEAIAAVAAKKKEKKAVKTVKVKAEDGSLTEKKVTGIELDKLRLQKARELDNERYN